MWTTGAEPAGRQASASRSDDEHSSPSGCAETENPTGQPSQQSMTGLR